MTKLPLNKLMLEQQALLYVLLLKHLSLEETMAAVGESIRLAEDLSNDDCTPSVPPLWNLAAVLAHSNCLADGCGHTVHNTPLPLVDRR